MIEEADLQECKDMLKWYEIALENLKNTPLNSIEQNKSGVRMRREQNLRGMIQLYKMRIVSLERIER